MANLGKTAQKSLKYLVRTGPRETARRAALHFGRKRAERHFVARMTPAPEELALQRKTEFKKEILFSVAVPLYNTPEDLLREMIDSVIAQSFENWELCLADGSDAEHAVVGEICRELAAREPRIRYLKLTENRGISENTNAALEMARGDYIALLDHDDLLMPNALYEVRAAVDKTGADFLYSDELIFQSPRIDRVIGIRFKPSFSPDSLLTNNYICHLAVFSRELLEKAGRFDRRFDGSQDHDLVLRLTHRARGIAHIAKVLYLWRSIPSSVASDIYSKSYAIEAGRSAVERFLREEKKTEASVESTDVFPTMYRVRYLFEEEPTVRVILDARKEKPDWRNRLDALRCSAGLKECAWTVIGAENGDGFTGLLPRAGERRSEIWARAAAESAEEYLLFADGVPGAASDGWLREMLGHARQDHVGAVGPKICFQNGFVRHAGVLIGTGPEALAGRAYFMEDEDNVGYFGQLAVVENVSAVTDCLLISRRKYEEAGGFSPAYGDSLFDVDLCLRLLEKGYYNVFTPHAAMKMGRTGDAPVDVGRETGDYARDAETFRKRNAKILRGVDPCFNANLDPGHMDWRIRDVSDGDGKANR